MPPAAAFATFDAMHALSLAGLTDIGRVRSRNEDSYSLDSDLGCAVVADGMGGHPGGDVASRIAVTVAMAALHRLLPAGIAIDEPLEDVERGMAAAMEESVSEAHAMIREEAARRPELDGMGTTLSCLAVERISGAYAIGHVGDSRVYRYRGGDLRQLSRDDTWVQDQVEAGQLAADAARGHPFGHVLTQCLGLDQPPRPHVYTGAVRPGDLYLLCTDGLVGMLDDARIADILGGEGARLEAVAADLVSAANASGGRDNVTVALLRVES